MGAAPSLGRLVFLCLMGQRVLEMLVSPPTLGPMSRPGKFNFSFRDEWIGGIARWIGIAFSTPYWLDGDVSRVRWCKDPP